MQLNDYLVTNLTGVDIKTSRNVKMRNTLTLISDNGEAIDLNVNIEADFETIPDKYHEVFLNMLMAKYYGKVSFGDNPFSQCLPPKKKKWYQFWK
jgi:hypothetical protein